MKKVFAVLLCLLLVSQAAVFGVPSMPSDEEILEVLNNTSLVKDYYGETIFGFPKYKASELEYTEVYNYNVISFDFPYQDIAKADLADVFPQEGIRLINIKVNDATPLHLTVKAADNDNGFEITGLGEGPEWSEDLAAVYSKMSNDGAQNDKVMYYYMSSFFIGAQKDGVQYIYPLTDQAEEFLNTGNGVEIATFLTYLSAAETYRNEAENSDGKTGLIASPKELLDLGEFVPYEEPAEEADNSGTMVIIIAAVLLVVGVGGVVVVTRKKKN